MTNQESFINCGVQETSHCQPNFASLLIDPSLACTSSHEKGPRELSLATGAARIHLLLHKGGSSTDSNTQSVTCDSCYPFATMRCFVVAYTRRKPTGKSLDDNCANCIEHPHNRSFDLAFRLVVGLLLIVLTVIFHVLALGFLNQKAVMIYEDHAKHRHAFVAFGFVVGATSLLATVFHALEVTLWAAVYCLIGALSGFRSALLYSLGAMTTYGNSELFLEERWKLMGPLEALNGWLLFGLSTAFLFRMIQEVSPRRPS
jgi:hypothetical protein